MKILDTPKFESSSIAARHNPSNRRNNEMRAKVCALYLGGKSVKDIGRIIGRHYSLPAKWVRQAGLMDAKRSKTPWNKRIFNELIHMGMAWENEWGGVSDSHWKDHPEIIKWEARRYYKANSKRIYQRQRSNPQHILRTRGRQRLRKYVRGIRINGAHNLFSCSIKFFKHWIESQFQSGMSWGNIDRWDIDHIVPCSKFDLSKEGEWKKCWHYSNLRPMWSADNRRKSARVIPNTQPELCITMP